MYEIFYEITSGEGSKGLSGQRFFSYFVLDRIRQRGQRDRRSQRIQLTILSILGGLAHIKGMSEQKLFTILS